MSSKAYILPHSSSAKSLGIDPSKLWSASCVNSPSTQSKPPKAGTNRIFYNTPSADHLTVISSLGPQAQSSPVQKREAVRKCIGTAVKSINKLGNDNIKEIVVDASEDPHAAAVAAHLAAYKFNLKTASSGSLFDPRSESGTGVWYGQQVLRGKVGISPLEKSEDWDRGVLYAQCQNLARTLMELPANMMTPTIFCERVKREFEGLENVEILVRDQAWAKEKGMNTFLSVARGSNEPAKFLEIHYRGSKDANARPLALVGKGITFDSGGISLKPSTDMKLMRGDMGGAATVVSTALGIAKMGLNINLVAVTPLTENMPGPSATRPGDIIYAMNGKSVEVDNTDAEGRLVLADALWYATTSFNPHTVIDIATLTGSMGIAVGEVFSGCFTNSDELYNKLSAIGLDEHDRFWRMPLDPEYAPQIEGSNADLCNTGGKDAGCCTAALFLRSFVNGLEDEGKNDSIKWAHLDIAGSMEAKTLTGAYQERGMTGRPVRPLIEFARQLAL